MPYPAANPTAKHDLVVPRSALPHHATNDPLGSSSLLIPNASALFHKLAEPISADMKLLASVYSYPDGPSQPLSRALYVVGVIPETHAVVRKLIGDADDASDLDPAFHRCSLAVKRADGRHAANLEARHVQNSTPFAKFVQHLRSEQVSAVLGQDKLGRMGILHPRPVEKSGAPGYDENDFHLVCFVGTTQAVKEALVNAVAPAAAEPIVPRSPTPPPGGFNDDGPVWDPNGDGDDDGPSFQPDDEPSFQPEDTTTSNGGGGGLWQPGSDGNDGSSSGLWEAPAASTSGADGLWDPSTSSGVDGGSSGGGLWDPSSGGDQNNGSGLWDPSGSNENGGGTASEWDHVLPDSTSSRKRSAPEEASNDDLDENGDGNNFHANQGAAAADKFYSNLTRNQGTRADSRLYHMRAFNGWVKATQIQELDPRTKGPSGRMGGPLRILDLACGKGGDLTKWVLHPRGIANYVGVDVARGSLVDAAIRARKMRNKMKLCTFSCADLGHDVPGRLRSSKHKHLQKLLTWSLQNEAAGESHPPDFKMLRGGGIKPDDRFDLVSIQFAIHYMMQTRNRARRFFRTVSQLLDVGGNLIATTIDARVVISHLLNLGLNLHFDDGSPDSLGADPVISVGGGACRITFEPHIVKQIFVPEGNDKLPESRFGLEYTFTLVEGSDHAAGVGDAVNLPEWLIPIPSLVALAEEVGLELEYAENFHEFYKNRSDPSVHSASHTSLYNMKVLNRNGSISEEEWEISRMYVAIKFRKVREPNLTPLDDDDAEEDEDVDEDEIDPAVKAKLMPMAMIKAKKASADKWDTLSAEERMSLTEVELRKLAKK